MKLNWKLGILAAIFLTVWTLYPQFKMWYNRGDEWQGHYAYNDIDEVAYASYIRALIDGRPRKNDPYTGRDDSPETPQPESLFSIQFAAPYTVAVPARIFGIGAPWAMTLAGAFAGFFAALAAFWLIGKLTGNSWIAFTGTLVMMAGGALAAGEGAIGEILEIGQTYPYFPAFRRYIPAVPFPFFIALLALVWLLVTTEDVRKRFIYGALASFCFGFTVFSYFYTWTTAAAWLGCVAVLWMIVRPEGFWKDFKSFLILGAGCLIPLIPYGILLSRRSETMDDVQLLVNTHAPDLLRFPGFLSFAVLIMLIAGILFKVIELKERSTLFALSFALVPLIIFNQQIVTGRSLQPIHYQVFIGNYVAGLALVVTVGILWRKAAQKKPLFSKIACACLALIAIAWGFVECHYTVRAIDDLNVVRDQALPVARRLQEFAKNDPEPFKSTVLYYGYAEADDLPTVAPQNVLWARHQHVFAGLSWQESKERYYQFLYYNNTSEESLKSGIMEGDFVSMIALFGWGRHTSRLSSEAKSLTYGEVAEEARRYGDYCKNFGIKQASNPLISYVVVPEYEDFHVDLTNLDRWYQRDAGEKFGNYMLYRVKLKN
jgi:hypothetical protein